MPIISVNLTYGELIELIKNKYKQYPNLDILNQPVTFKQNEEYFNIIAIEVEDDGHFTLI